MIDDLQSQTEGEAQRAMLSIGLTFAALVFKKKDQDWLRRRISMLEAILQESPFYQRILHQGEEKGRAEALQQAQQDMLHMLRQMLVDAVQTHLPREAALIRMVRTQAAIIKKPEVLQRLILTVGTLQTPDEVQNRLLSSNSQ